MFCGGVCSLVMKLQNSFQLSGCGLLALALAVNATPVPDRFASIARDNAFHLNPPKPEVIAVIPSPERPRITLQGVTTILGRPQVLVNIQQPAKAAGASEISCVLTEGESRNGVTVLEIDMVSGTIRLNNNGEEQILRSKG